MNKIKRWKKYRGRDNPIIKCKKPDCTNTLTKYPIRKDGYILWTRPREYCYTHGPLPPIMYGRDNPFFGHKNPKYPGRENPIVKCAIPTCLEAFTKYSIRKYPNKQTTRWTSPREYCRKHHPHIEDVGNGALHAYVRRHLPEPKLCERCKEYPPYDLANITGVYTRDSKNWKYLCRACHFIVDSRNEVLKLALMNKKVARLMGLSGRFHTRLIRPPILSLYLSRGRRRNEIL